MAVRRLSVTDFRCYRAATVEADAVALVLTGPNGAGKTNLLEAVSLLAPGRGLRRAKLSAIARQDPDKPDDPPRNWAVAARLDTALGQVDIGTGRDPEAPDGSDRRLVRIDGAAQKAQSVLAEYVATAWLVPSMDRLFLDGASGRRRFLDRMVYSLDTGHAGRVSAYEHAMRERNRLLKQGGADSRWLTALEDTMAETGVAISAARVETLQRLRIAIDEADGSFPRPDLDITGGLEPMLDSLPAVAAEDRFRAALAEGRALDAVTGGAVQGPHRADLLVRHRDKRQPAGSCSTGEQKALLIAIVLAEARLCAKIRGFPPILLLDEVVAHLDAVRRAALFDAIRDVGAQAWLTGTDRALFAALEGRAQFIGVEDASVHVD